MIIKIIKNGFTLVEMVIVVAIVVIMAMILIANLNPGQLVGRANDATRKKDLSRMRVAFEEYMSDKGCYPSGELLEALNNQDYCGSDVFLPWLNKWPCDPVKRLPYPIFVDPLSGCPHWFSIYTNLDNKTDNDIPDGWYDKSLAYAMGNGTLNVNQTNYGVSSTNVKWYDATLSIECATQLNECYTYAGGVCRALDVNFQHFNAYTVCNRNCMVDCCFMGKPCP